ncbi:hypothetical protein HAX54_009230, partial [Datura stramonium]|nr:hypothetical protein [Datura stramonium]
MKEEEDEKKIKSSDDNPDSCTDQPGAVDRKQDDHDSVKKKEFPQEDDCSEDQGIRLCKGPSNKIGTTQKRSVQTALKEDDISSNMKMMIYTAKNDGSNHKAVFVALAYCFYLKASIP